MPLPEPLVSTIAVVLVVVAMLADGRRAVLIATLAVALGVLTTAVSAGGQPGLLVIGGACVVAVALGPVAGAVASRLRWAGGLDPLVPVFASTRQLFGPRSVRVWAAAVAIPVASWASFYVAIGQVTTVQGQLFPVAYAWVCGVLRLVVARTIEDMAVGVAMVGMASAAAWLLRGSGDALSGAAAFAALAPAAAVTASWLRGRRTQRPMA